MKKREETSSGFDDIIDLTPMINVSLILVIVFLCVSPMALMTGIKAVNSGSRDNSINEEVSLGKSTKDELVLVVLNKDGKLFINGAEIERRMFNVYLKDAILLSPKKEVLVSADDENSVEEVVALLDLAKRNGASKVILAE